MPCPILSLSFSDYMEETLKNIDQGNDTSKKICACALIPTLNTDKCQVYYNEGAKQKSTLFPSCSIISLPDNTPDICDKGIYQNGNLQLSDYWNGARGIGFTPRQMMYIYWKAKKFKLSGNISAASSLEYNEGTIATALQISLRNSSSKYHFGRGSFDVNGIPEYKKISDVICLSDLVESRETNIFYDYYNFRDGTATLKCSAPNALPNSIGFKPTNFPSDVTFAISRNNIIYYKDKYYPLIDLKFFNYACIYNLDLAQIGCTSMDSNPAALGNERFTNIRKIGKFTIRFPFPSPDDKAVGDIVMWSRFSLNSSFLCTGGGNLTLDIDARDVRENE